MSAATCALRFRCVDGVDVGPTEYPLTLSVAKLKAQLAEDVKGNAAIKTPPQSAADLKLIHGGKILDNTKTLADYHLASGADESGEPIVTTLHLWIRPAGAAPAKSAESQKGKAAEPKCACVVS